MMRRAKKHRIKQENPEASSSSAKTRQDQDLAYFIHDRVELLHQVFSLVNPKDLQSMAPECVRRLSIDDLQELCLEELLGISSKRLCAILDGAEPPSDTESSSASSSDDRGRRDASERVETISLDSISSDDEVLSQASSKKHKKHKRRRDSKSKSKHKKKAKGKDVEEVTEATDNSSKATRAGLTVLELLELQARARAIRAQLQQEQAHKAAQEPDVEAVEAHDSEPDEVEIKEERVEVVEISSEDEKPDVKELERRVNNADPKPSTSKTTPSNKENNVQNGEPTTVTKRVSNLIITVPQTKQTRKIKLNRKKNNVSTESSSDKNTATAAESNVDTVADKEIEFSKKSQEDNQKNIGQDTENISKDKSVKDKGKKKKKDKKKKITEKDGSDHDEIMLQLSDTEKMDVLEDFNRKEYDNVSSSDSESSSSDSNEEYNSDESKNDANLNKKSENNTNKSVTQSEVQENTVVESSENKTFQVNNVHNVNDEIKSQNNDSECKQNIVSDDTDSIVIDINQKSDNIQNVEAEIAVSDVTESVDNKSKSVTDTQINDNDEVDMTVLSATEQNDNDKTVEMNVGEGVTEVIYSVTASSKEIDADAVEDVDDSSAKKIATEEVPETNNVTLDKEMVREEKVTLEVDGSEAESVTRLNTSESKINETANNDKTTDDDVQLVQESNVTNKMNKFQRIQITIQNNLASSNNDAIENKSSDNVGIVTIQSEISKTSHKTIENKASTEQGTENKMSEGELSDRESSEVEAMDVQPEIVCISDEEDLNKEQKKKKNKKEKKKDKKSKKEKKAKKSKSDFREGADQNFYRVSAIDNEVNIIDNADSIDKSLEKSLNKDLIIDIDVNKTKFTDTSKINSMENIILSEDDDVYEILELSDDSSCYEVEGISVSKEPTVAEIEALSARIDEIDSDREEVVTEEQIKEHERLSAAEYTNKNNEIDSNVDNTENISWKDRYLDSKKVKRVLTTSNILNALRKKNKKLKRKIEESKVDEKLEEIVENVIQDKSNLEEGSIDQYNTLQASTTYVDPVTEIVEKAESTVETDQKGSSDDQSTGIQGNNSENDEKGVSKSKITGEMKKDAKQLLKMYKKLLKYNDLNKQKDPNSKKKKKHKKSKNKDKNAVGQVAVVGVSQDI